MKNVFIHCGLNHTLEYHILSQPDFKKRAYEKEHTKYYVPSILLESDAPYTVIGVDMHRKKNEQLRDMYQDNPRIHIWDYAIWHEDVEEFTTHGEYSVIPEYMGEDEAQLMGSVPAITLSTLFDKVYAIEGHADAKIRGLHLNIESSEMNALQGIDWNSFPYPEVIRVSTSHWHNLDVDKKSRKYCLETLQCHGYEFKEDPRDLTNDGLFNIEFARFNLKEDL